MSPSSTAKIPYCCFEQATSRRSDLADQHSLVFSSGSSGGLKGLVISRTGVERTLPPIMDMIGTLPSDRMQLFLPMSNFQQRNMCYAAIWYDYDIVITDFTQLFASMKALNPTILIAPPIFFEMVFAEFARRSRWGQILIKRARQHYRHDTRQKYAAVRRPARLP